MAVDPPPMIQCDPMFPISKVSLTISFRFLFYLGRLIKLRLQGGQCFMKKSPLCILSIFTLFEREYTENVLVLIKIRSFRKVFLVSIRKYSLQSSFFQNQTTYNLTELTEETSSGELVLFCAGFALYEDDNNKMNVRNC